MIATQARNASLEDLVSILRVQHNAKHDAVVPATAIASYAAFGEGYSLEVAGMGADGPAGIAGQFTCTDIFDEHVAERFDVPRAYLRRMRETRPDILDEIINRSIHGEDIAEIQPDQRRFFLRTFLDPEGGPGIARALLSDSYRPIDNLDVLTSALDGIQRAGVDAEIEKCQISERRMAIDIVCPQIGVVAGELLRNYRSPFDTDGIDRAGGWTLERGRAAAAREDQGYEPGSEPMFWAGFQLANSELGGGAYTLCPRIVLSPCRNGLKISEDMMRKVHVGAQLAKGVVKWSDETKAANLTLVTSMTTDAITSWLNVDYVSAFVARLQGADGVVNVPANDAVQLVGTHLGYSEEARAGILDHFIRGGQFTGLGMVNAITSYAQTVDSPDTAYELENNALDALAVLCP